MTNGFQNVATRIVNAEENTEREDKQSVSSNNPEREAVGDPAHASTEQTVA